MKPTAGWSIAITSVANVVGIIHEFDSTHEGDNEEYSGTNSPSTDGVIRRITAPVDKGLVITFSGKLDTTATGYDDFTAAMEARTPDTVIVLFKDTESVEYTGHSNSYNESMSRSENVWNFSCTFEVNEEADVVVS